MLVTILFLDSLGGGELLMIMLFILLFFGSGKIPDLARGLGRSMREFKDAMSGVQRDIENSVREKEYKNEIQKTVPPVKSEEAETGEKKDPHQPE